MAKKVDVPRHRGAVRQYFCPEFFTKDGNLDLNRHAGCTINTALTDGDEIPSCAHGLLRKPRFKRVADRRYEMLQKSRMMINGTHMWQDVARRKSLCRICFADILPGEKRFAFETPKRGAQIIGGGIATSVRSYVHMTCFFDRMGGGIPAKGCPGCTAKLELEEYKAMRKMLEKRYA